MRAVQNITFGSRLNPQITPPLGYHLLCTLLLVRHNNSSRITRRLAIDRPRFEQIMIEVDPYDLH